MEASSLRWGCTGEVASVIMICMAMTSGVDGYPTFVTVSVAAVKGAGSGQVRANQQSRKVFRNMIQIRLCIVVVLDGRWPGLDPIRRYGLPPPLSNTLAVAVDGKLQGLPSIFVAWRGGVVRRRACRGK
jgi:hypothetical protein